MDIGKLLLIWMAICTCVLADCPDFTFRCPTGESFTIGTCYNWRRAGCFTCRGMEAEIHEKCRKFQCNGFVSNWYGRNDGCSAPLIGGMLNEVFRFACGIHDICYATPGRSKSQCDDDFLHNMKETCHFPGIHSVGKPICLKTADTIHSAVHQFGTAFPDFARSCIEV